MIRYLEDRHRKQLIPWIDEDNILIDGVNNILIMEVKLLRIDELSKDRVSRDLANNDH